MNSPESAGAEERLDISRLTLEEMRDELFARGWEYDSKFARSYARVNPLLEGGEWKSVVHGFPSVLHDAMPDRRPGLAVGTEGGETEVTVTLYGDIQDRDDVGTAYVMDHFLRSSGFEDVDEASLADWLIMKGQKGDLRPGSKEYYEQTPRSAELRAICLGVIAAYRVVAREGAEGTPAENLLVLNGRLAELEITPQMHTGERPVFFMDPIRRAEWVAGQLRSMLHEGYGLTGDILAKLREHDVLTGDASDRFVVLGPDAPDDAFRAGYFMMALESFAEHLDAAADYPEA